MARYKRRYRRWGSGYYKKKWKRSATTTYFDVKMEWDGKVQWPSSNGTPILLALGATNGFTARTFNQLMSSGSTAWNQFQQLFSYYRVRGVAIEAIPDASFSGAAGGVYDPEGNPFGKVITNFNPVHCCCLFGTTITLSDALARANNNSFVLEPLQKTRKYIRSNGGTNDYKTTAEDYPGLIQLVGASNVNSASGSWTITITFYVRFKKQKDNSI